MFSSCVGESRKRGFKKLENASFKQFCKKEIGQSLLREAAAAILPPVLHDHIIDDRSGDS
jgi:hypothetical protein